MTYSIDAGRARSYKIALDWPHATADDFEHVAQELPGATANALLGAFPILGPQEGRYVPANVRNGQSRYVQALTVRGLAEPDPEGVWPAYLTVWGLLVRDCLIGQILTSRAQLLADYRRYVAACPGACMPDGVAASPTRVDTHVCRG